MSRLTLPLFVHHEQGRGELPKDDREAVRLYEIAADQGAPTAQSYLGPLDAACVASWP